jgi:hypothetical protein
MLNEPVGDLRDFRERMLERAPMPSSYRPFTCDGDPYDKVFWIVGSNATRTVGEFWRDYWDDVNGMRYKAFQEAYEAQGKISDTTIRIRRLLELVDDRRWLITNAYAQPTLREHQVTDYSIDALKFLIKEMKPQTILVHGGTALKRLTSVLAERGTRGLIRSACRASMAEVATSYGSVQLRAVKHLCLPYWTEQRLGVLAHEVSRSLNKVSASPFGCL